MLVEVRPHGRLRSAGSTKPVDLSTSLVPVVEALSEGSADLAKVRVVCDWVQYKENFRGVVDARAITHQPLGTAAAPVPMGVRDDDVEIAVDVRRSGGQDRAALKDVTAALLTERPEHVVLEDWGRGSESLVWDFNALYWSCLELWEKASGRTYEQALPGGESDARNRDAAAELVDGLFAAWDRLAAAGALPEELYVVELGVGNGSQAKVFLDVLQERDRRDYYSRLHYLMCDYSQHVLDLARETVAEHREHVSSFVLDAVRPLTSLAFLQYKVFLVYISNMYDNLPTDEVALLGGRTYCVQTRAYLPAGDAAEIAAGLDVEPAALPALVGKLLRLGPTLLAEAVPQRFGDVSGVDAAVGFWRAVWSAIRLEERYVPLAGLDTYPLVAGDAIPLSGELLRPLLESGADLRMHVNNGALNSFTESLRMLHPFGSLVCHDLFVTEVEGYRTQFRGPGKYDGSVVNWVNGPLLAHVGRRLGFEVRYQRFRHRSGGNIVTMTAQVGD